MFVFFTACRRPSGPLTSSKSSSVVLFVDGGTQGSSRNTNDHLDRERLGIPVRCRYHRCRHRFVPMRCAFVSLQPPLLRVPVLVVDERVRRLPVLAVAVREARVAAVPM